MTVTYGKRALVSVIVDRGQVTITGKTVTVSVSASELDFRLVNDGIQEYRPSWAGNPEVFGWVATVFMVKSNDLLWREGLFGPWVSHLDLPDDIMDGQLVFAKKNPDD